MTDKKKLGLLFGGVVATVLIQMLFGGSVEALEGQHLTSDQELRLRVIAHSDDSFDQVIKRVAAFAVEEILNEHNGTDMEGFVQENLVEIRGNIERVFAEIDVEMEVEVSFGYHYFPASSGYYQSLVVRIGDGAGENWWCFINPGICAAPSDQVAVTEVVQYRFGDHTRQFVDGLFSRSSNEVISASSDFDVIDWFLFDDERE